MLQIWTTLLEEVKNTPADTPLVRCSVSANQETLLMSWSDNRETQELTNDIGKKEDTHKEVAEMQNYSFVVEV